MGERGPYCREGAKRVLKSTETQDKLGCRGGPSRERVRPRRPSDSPEIQVEEIAFEVLDTERLAHATDKVEKFAKRGVRRLFAVRVASRKVYEWDHAHHDWTELAEDAVITDRCFRVPVPVKALVDRVLADDTVARALIARGNRVLVEALAQREDKGRKEGHNEGRKEGLDQGIGPLVHQFERRLRRTLSEEERSVLQGRLGSHGPARLGDVVLDLDPEVLARWLADPNAR